MNIITDYNRYNHLNTYTYIMADWNIVKAEIEQDFTHVPKVNKVFKRKYITLIRRVNTLRNMIYVNGYTFERALESQAYDTAMDLIHEINTDYRDEYVEFARINCISTSLIMDDLLA